MRCAMSPDIKPRYAGILPDMHSKKVGDQKGHLVLEISDDRDFRAKTISEKYINYGIDIFMKFGKFSIL